MGRGRELESPIVLRDSLQIQGEKEWMEAVLKTLYHGASVNISKIKYLVLDVL